MIETSARGVATPIPAFNASPLSSEERTRFRNLAPTLPFSGLLFKDHMIAKGLLGTMLTDDNALANAPALINATPGISAPVKRFFDEAFKASRVPPTLANGATVPRTETVAIICGVVGLLLGAGLAVLVVD